MDDLVYSTGKTKSEYRRVSIYHNTSRSHRSAWHRSRQTPQTQAISAGTKTDIARHSAVGRPVHRAYSDDDMFHNCIRTIRDAANVFIYLLILRSVAESQWQCRFLVSEV